MSNMIELDDLNSPHTYESFSVSKTSEDHHSTDPFSTPDTISKTFSKIVDLLSSKKEEGFLDLVKKERIFRDMIERPKKN